MGGAGGVPAGEDGHELGDAVGAGLLEAPRTAPARVPPGEPEHWPCASQCQISTAAPARRAQAWGSSRTVSRTVSGTPGLPSVMSLRKGAPRRWYGPAVVPGVSTHNSPAAPGLGAVREPGAREPRVGRNRRRPRVPGRHPRRRPARTPAAGDVPVGHDRDPRTHGFAVGGESRPGRPHERPRCPGGRVRPATPCRRCRSIGTGRGASRRPLPSGGVSASVSGAGQPVPALDPSAVRAQSRRDGGRGEVHPRRTTLPSDAVTSRSTRS